MNYRPTVHVLQGLGHLVDDEAYVDFFEDAFGDDVMQISLHKLEKQVDILVVIGSNGIVQFYNVGVIQLFEDLNFAIGALGISGVLKCIEYFLESEYLFGGLLLDLPDVSVGT